MAGLMQLLLDTVDAGIDDANYQKIQHLKVNEILLNQTNSVIDKEKNSQNQDLVDAISNERHANAAKVNKELGRDFLIDFDSNAFIKKVNGQIIGKIKEFGNFSSEVVADLYTKSVLELTMQIANGGIDTIERIASNSSQGVSEIVATSFNVAKNTPSFYKYENNTEILKEVKSDALVTGVLIAGYASLTQEEKDKLWENALGLPPDQMIQLYEAEVADNPYQDYPGKTEEGRKFTKANSMQFRVSGLIRSYIFSKGNLLNKGNFDKADFESFVRSQTSIDPNIIDEIFSKEYINFIDQEFDRIYESASTPVDDKNRFQTNEIIFAIDQFVETGRVIINENGQVDFLDPELEKTYHENVYKWNQTLSNEHINSIDDLKAHVAEVIESITPNIKKDKIEQKVDYSSETKEYSDRNKLDHAKNISDIRQKSFFTRMQETTSLSKDELFLALTDFIEFVKTNDEEILEFIADSCSSDILFEKIESLDEDFFKEHPHFKSIVNAIGIEAVTKNISNPTKRNQWLEELSKMDFSKEPGSTITEQEAKLALEERKEDMIVAPIPTKDFHREESNNKILEPNDNSFENPSEDTSSNNGTDSSAPKLEEINTAMVVSNTAVKATTVGGFWSNFMRHMREDKESKGLIKRIKSAYKKAREDRDKANGFAVEEDSTSTSESSGSTEELTEQEAFNKSLQVDTSKSTPIAPQPEKTTNDTKSRDPEEPTQGPDDPTL